MQAVSGDICISTLSHQTIVMAMEYRRVANSYLSTDAIRAPHAIELSPIASVNQMLVADKVQNKKDFIAKIYDNGNDSSVHQASERLLDYFDSWLTALGVLPQDYDRMAAELRREFSDRE